MAHIVVLGAGIGGLPAAYELKAALGRAHRVTVINAVDHFQFVPSNPWLAVGWRDRDAVTMPLRPPLEKKGIAFIAKPALRIDADTHAIELSDGQRIGYDYLVIATGPRLAFEEVPGSGPHAVTGGHTQSVCSVDHAEDARQAYERFVQDPGPAIIGAMPGASCFGPAYEFALIFSRDLQKRKLRHKVPITFVTPEPCIGHLGLGGVGDTQGMLESELRQHDIKWICNAKVTRVEAGKMHVTELDDLGRVKKEHELPFHYSMMLPAFKGVDPVAAVEGLCNPRGFVLIDEHQRSRKYRNIYAAGVCVAIAPVEATPVPTGAPKTGYMIESMVTAIVHNIAADLRGAPATARGSWNAFCLMDMGDTGTAIVAQPQMPPRNVNWASRGRWVHLAKIGFEKYFLYKMRTGSSEPLFEKYALKSIGLSRLAGDGSRSP